MWFLIYNSAWVLSRSYWPLALFDLNSRTIDLSVVKARKSFNEFLLLNDIFNEPPLISYKRERSVKNILVRTIQNSRKAKPGAQEARRPGTLLDTKKRITNQNCSYNFWLKFLSHFKRLKHARGSRAGPSSFFPKFHWNVCMLYKFLKVYILFYQVCLLKTVHWSGGYLQFALAVIHMAIWTKMADLMCKL